MPKIKVVNDFRKLLSHVFLYRCMSIRDECCHIQLLCKDKFHTPLKTLILHGLAASCFISLQLKEKYLFKFFSKSLYQNYSDNAIHQHVLPSHTWTRLKCITLDVVQQRMVYAQYLALWPILSCRPSPATTMPFSFSFFMSVTICFWYFFQ